MLLQVALFHSFLNDFFLKMILLLLFYLFLFFGHATWHVGSWLLDQGSKPHCVLEVWSLNHWATREVLILFHGYVTLHYIDI